MSKFKAALRGAGCIATILTMGSQIAIAQEETAPEENERKTAVQRMLDTVTVTATKQKDPENVQDIATAVTAFNAETLDTLKVRNLEDVSYNAPNVVLADIGTVKGAANFAMRGFGTNSSIVTIDPTVGVVVDGIPLGVAAGVVLDMFDLDSIEILRGPQGILQGRNTVGGVVAVNTGNPTSDFQYSVKLSTESPIDDGRGGFNSYVQGTVSGPIVPDKLNGKLAAYFNKDEGYFKNLANNQNHGEAEATIIRAALEFLPTDNFTMLAKVEHSNFDGDGPASQNRALYDRNSFDFAIDNTGFYDVKSTFGSLRMDWDVGFGDGTITNITGYRKYEADTDSDIDSLPVPIFDGPSVLDTNQFTNELRYNGSFGDMTVTSGLFYMDQTIELAETRWIPVAALGGRTPFPGGGIQDHQTTGLFTQLEYQFTDKFSMQGGLRYTIEEKDVDVTYIIPALLRGIPNCSVIEGTCPTDFSDKKEWNVLTPKIAMEYEVNDSGLFYASYNKGFRSGGYNFRLTNPTVSAALDAQINNGNRYFDKESIDAFEVGYKFESDGGSVLLNSAVFLTKAKDMQREINVSSPTGVSQFIYNTADAEMKGLELEGRFVLSDNFLITANLGYIDAEYTDIRFPISAVSVTELTTATVQDSDYDLELPRTAKYTYGIGAVWDQSLGNAGSLVSTVNFQHRDKNPYTDNNAGFFNAADILNFNVAWNTPKDGLSVSLYGKNMFDEVTAGGDTQTPFAAEILGQQSLGPPTFSPLNKGRLIGIELSFKG